MTALSALVHAYADRRTQLRYAGQIMAAHQPVQIRAQVMLDLEPFLEELWQQTLDDVTSKDAAGVTS
jgi:hypothetical protein